MKYFKSIVKKIISSFGYVMIPEGIQYPIDIKEDEKILCKKLESFTLSNQEAMWTLIDVVKYVIKNDIPGDIVECGVWKGGSAMAIANTLVKLDHLSKDIYLYDTFEEGMTNPSDDDIDFRGKSAKQFLKEFEKKGQNWAGINLDTVKKNVLSSNYPLDKIKFIRGIVEDTIPKNIPEKISILRLDTDFYESTKHELIHLYPRLSKYGILIIDDYGAWKGSKKATDEYFKDITPGLFLIRISRDGVRIALKTS